MNTRCLWLIWAVVAALPLSRGSGAEESESLLPEGAGRVLMVEHPDATITFNPQSGPIGKIVRQGLIQFTSKPTVREAWQSLVTPRDVVGIKVYSAPGPNSGTRPAVVGEVVRSLVESGHPTNQIYIWDRRLADLRLAGFFEVAEKFNVKIAGSLDKGYDPDVYYETPLIGRLVYGDLEFGVRADGVGRKSHVSKLLTKEITKIVNVTPLLNHNLAGVSGVLLGLAMGSVDNILRFDLDSARLANAIPEIYALPELSDRVALNILDAVICQYQGEERTRLHFSSALNQLWFSKDPVALDVLALEELQRQRRLSKTPEIKVNNLIYENAGLLDLGVNDLRKIKIERLDLSPARK